MTVLQPDRVDIRPLDLEKDYDAYLETKRLAGLPDPDNDDLDSLQRLLRFCPASILVADSEQEQCIGTVRTSFTTPRIIGGLAVRPAWQGKGVGRILMTDVLYRMSAIGLKTSELLLDVDIDMPRPDLERFYEQFNFSRSFGALGMVRSHESDSPWRSNMFMFDADEPDIRKRHFEAFRHLMWEINQDIHQEYTDLLYFNPYAFNNGVHFHGDERLKDAKIMDSATGIYSREVVVQTLEPHSTTLIQDGDHQLLNYQNRWGLIHNTDNHRTPVRFLSLITHPSNVEPRLSSPFLVGYHIACDLSADEVLPLRLDKEPSGSMVGRRWGAHMNTLEGKEADQLLDKLVFAASSLRKRFPAELVAPAYYSLETGKRIRK